MAEYTKNYNLEKQQESDYVNIGGINDNFDVIDEELKSAAEKADQAFLSASNGKQVIKTAIAGKDPSVTIPTDTTFTQLAEAIGQIETGVDTEDATAKAEHILEGMTAYVKGKKVTGTIPTHPGGDNVPYASYMISGNTLLVKPPEGHLFSGGSVIVPSPDVKTENIRAGANILGVSGKSTVVDTQDAVLDPAYLVQGYSGYDDGVKKAGTMINRSAENHHQPAASSTISDANGYGAYVVPPAGYYNGSSWVRSLQPDLLSANILQGKNIFGIAGSAVQGKRWASGIVKSNGNPSTFDLMGGDVVNFYGLNVTGLNFLPSMVLALRINGVYDGVTDMMLYCKGGIGFTRDTSVDIYIHEYAWINYGLQNRVTALLKATGAAYVTDTGFNLPALKRTESYTYYAYE